MSPENSHVIDVDASNFQAAVAERSLETPVLVDLWATWCEPCKTLGPVLEKAAADYNGAFILAKVDVDKSPEIAQALGVQSVPTVFLLKGGRPVDAFAGVVTEKQLQEFMTKNEVEAGEPSEEEDAGPIAAAQAMAAAGDFAGAISMLAELNAEEALDLDGVLCLAELQAESGDVEAAGQTLDGLSAPDSDDGRVAELRAKLSLAGGADLASAKAAAAANPEDAHAQLELGKAMVSEGDVEGGLDVIWKIARVDLELDDRAPHKALLEVFQAVGHDDPRVLSYQQRLSVLLCS
jgi:putative thioredoxin